MLETSVRAKTEFMTNSSFAVAQKLYDNLISNRNGQGVRLTL